MQMTTVTTMPKQQTSPFQTEEMKSLLHELAANERRLQDYSTKAARLMNRNDRIREAISRGLGTWTGQNRLIRAGKTHYLIGRSTTGHLTINAVKVEAA